MKSLPLAGIVLAAATAVVIGIDRPAASDASSAPLVLVNRDRNGLALQGYDAVAYFDGGKPVLGDSRFRTRHAGAIYQFASKQHQQQFEADPGRFVPQYGGYCGYAASIDKLSPVSPEWFQVLDGKLILQHNKKAWDLWNEDVGKSLAQADANWPGLVARHGVELRTRNLINVDREGVALQGYDPVAYFTEDRAVPGEAAFEAVYDGGTYRFASADHKELFERNPSKYAPAFGGYCAYAASINKVSPIDPTIFQIEDGRLLLQHTQKAYDLFNADAAANLVRADANWPRLVVKHGT